MNKPLFIPLKTKYYEQFVAGVKQHEYRPDGKRWNDKTCYPKRPVVLSKGYGKKHRRNGYIIESFVCEPTADFLSIYGAGVPCRAIRIMLTESECV
jgi:hypothetical protein